MQYVGITTKASLSKYSIIYSTTIPAVLYIYGMYIMFSVRMYSISVLNNENKYNMLHGATKLQGNACTIIMDCSQVDL